MVKAPNSEPVRNPTTRGTTSNPSHQQIPSWLPRPQLHQSPIPPSQAKHAGKVSYVYAAVAALAPAFQWTTIQRKKATEASKKPDLAKTPAIGLHRFALVRDYGDPTPLCDAVDIKPALHQEKAPADARLETSDATAAIGLP